MKLRTKKQVMELCGDVLDRFPCRHCGAKSPNECRVPMDQRKAATDAINNPVRNALPVEDHIIKEAVAKAKEQGKGKATPEHVTLVTSGAWSTPKQVTKVVVTGPGAVKVEIR